LFLQLLFTYHTLNGYRSQPSQKRQKQDIPMRRFAFLAIACYLVAACTAPSQTATSKSPPSPQLTSTPYSITVIADLAYARALTLDGSDLLLDLYTPTAPGTFPVVIHAHGAPGSKNNDSSVWFGKTLAAHGFVVLVANWDSFDPRQTGWQCQFADESGSSANFVMLSRIRSRTQHPPTQ
jgi:predicted dienelactone hydrolase